MQHLAIRFPALLALLIGVGCTRSGKTPDTGSVHNSPNGPGAPKTSPPEQMSYDHARADVKLAVGKRVVWRGKLVQWLGKEDLVSNKGSTYYLLLAENPERQGEYTESRPFLLDEDKTTLGPAAKNAIRIEQVTHVVILAKSKWQCRPCNDIILTVTGTVAGEMEFHSASKKLPNSAPLVAAATIELPTDK